MSDEIDDLRELAARLRSLARAQPGIADRLREIANDADDRADEIAGPLRHPRPR